MTQILILEDIPETQLWLKSAAHIAFPNATIEIADSLEKGRFFVRSNTFDLCLLDLQLPDGKGEELLIDLQTHQANCVNIIVTIYDDEDHLLPCLQNGAHGYILKDQSKQKISEMLAQALEGELPLSPRIAQLVLKQFSKPTLESLPISKREAQVLTLIAQGRSTPQVAEEIFLSKYTVEDHIKNIYKKLGISSRSEAVIKAQEFGLI